MSGTITRAAYQQLVDEDICWLERQPRTLERDHVIDIVRHSVEVYYGELRDLRDQVAQLTLELTGCRATLAEEYALGDADRQTIATLRAQVAQLTLERDREAALADHQAKGVETFSNQIAAANSEVDRLRSLLAEAQRPHCTTERIEGVWWAKCKSGGVYGPHSTEREALLEVAEMARSEQLKADAP